MHEKTVKTRATIEYEILKRHYSFALEMLDAPRSHVYMNAMQGIISHYSIIEQAYNARDNPKIRMMDNVTRQGLQHLELLAKALGKEVYGEEFRKKWRATLNNVIDRAVTQDDVDLLTRIGAVFGASKH